MASGCSLRGNVSLHSATLCSGVGLRLSYLCHHCVHPNFLLLSCWMSDSKLNQISDASEENEKHLDKWKNIMFNYLSLLKRIDHYVSFSSFSTFS